MVEERKWPILAERLPSDARYASLHRIKQSPLANTLTFFTACCPCLDFNHETQRLFVGLENGVISEFVVGDDFNKMTHHRDYFCMNDE